MLDDTGPPLSSLGWMPSRIPVRDALVVFVPDGQAPPPIPVSSGEQRWYPQPGGHKVVVPYSGESFDSSIFKIQRGFWDHTTCDLCAAHVPAMTLCYVTRNGAYKELCADCYKAQVVAKAGQLRALLWHIKRIAGIAAAA